ncbi:MAG: hypothetical protein ABI564_07120 [Ideonella sp.]
MKQDPRKVLESTPEPASLDRTMPAPPKPAREGANLGGITQTAESGLRDSQQSRSQVGQSSTSAAPQPKSATGESASGHARPPAATPHTGSKGADDDAARADENTPEDESPLESLGRAIGAPLSGEAAEKEPRR